MKTGCARAALCSPRRRNSYASAIGSRPSAGSCPGYDFNVSFTEEQMESGQAFYNYRFDNDEGGTVDAFGRYVPPEAKTENSCCSNVE